MSQLPIESVMTELVDKVQSSNQVILKAAPGAGKSTYFPLQLVKQNCINGKIIMLEPRRLAARNIATYLSRQLGEKVGQTVGYRIRGEAKVSSETRLEIVTEGIMTNMIQSDPELSGVGLLIFDEYHERSIHADTALAFSLEIQGAFRDDLKLVIMSATLDSEALKTLLPEGEYVESEGRSFPVEQRYVPMSANERLIPSVVKQTASLFSKEKGSILVFLPGVGSIKQVERGLQELALDAEIAPLYGQLSFNEQEKAIFPPADGKRKIVLATNVAETSLTIEGIRIVLDSGLERVAKFDPKSGVTKLEEIRIAQSSAVQRAGRAGRLQEGLCVRMYSESQFNQQPIVPVPEVLRADLSSLAMELAQWGAEAKELSWLDTPPNASLEQGKDLLRSLGLLSDGYQPNEHTQRIQKLGIEPRLGAMLMRCESISPKVLNTALSLVPLLEEPERHISDIGHSLYRLLNGMHPKSKQLSSRASLIAKRMGRSFEPELIDESYVGVCLAFGYPDRIAKHRSGRFGSFVLTNGHGAYVDEQNKLAEQTYLVVVDLMRINKDESQIFLATDLDINLLESVAPELFFEQESVDWDDKRGRLIAEQQRCLGNSKQNLVIKSNLLPEPDKDKVHQALLKYLRRKGLKELNWDEKSKNLRERVACASEWLPENAWPSMEDECLLKELENWLEPYMVGVNSVKGLRSIHLYEALSAYLGWPLNQEIDEWLPVSYQVPTGNTRKIQYRAGSLPVLSVRMQEMFGEQDSPLLAKGRVRLTLELLSPAQRPLQVTSDLAGFWAGAYKEVQKEMKGRYPKHPWPDDPANHIATTKTKRQLSS